MNPAPANPPAQPVPVMSARGFVGHASLWEFAHALGDNRRALLLGYLLLLGLVLIAWVVSPYARGGAAAARSGRNCACTLRSNMTGCCCAP